MTAVKRSLRIAGALYLLGVVLGGVAQLAARAGIRLPGAATSAGQHIDAQPATLQVSLVADIAMAWSCSPHLARRLPTSAARSYESGFVGGEGHAGPGARSQPLA